MSDDLVPQDTEFLLYPNEDGSIRIDVRLHGETVWLTQMQMAALFGRDKRTISDHIQTVFDDEELDPAATVRKFRTVQIEGSREVTRLLDHYSLDVILAVGYRVRSRQGTRFRQWATERLKEFIVKGFVLDDQRLAEGRTPDSYFDDLIERVRAIRTSERNFWRKITDIYATSIDYDGKAAISQQFFATVQNKMHFAVHGHTAAEIIHQRADSTKPNMGVTVTSGKTLRKKDVATAKNYLTEDELKDLNLIVDQYLSFAESQARRRIPMNMQDWLDKLHGFLTLNDREILQNPGRISHDRAVQKAEDEFAKYQALEDERRVSDFDRFEQSVAEILPPKKTPKKKPGKES